MPSLQVEINHQLTKDQAKERLKKFVNEIFNKYKHDISELKINWVDDKNEFSFLKAGMKISGSLTIHPNLIIVKSQIPFAFYFMKSQIIKIIKQYGIEVLRKY